MTWKKIYAPRIRNARRFVVKKRFTNDFVACKEVEVFGTMVKMEIEAMFKKQKNPTTFYVHERGNFHSPFRQRIRTAALHYDSYLSLQNDMIQELPSSNCDELIEYDSCFHGVLNHYMNKSAGCIFLNSW